MDSWIKKSLVTLASDKPQSGPIIQFGNFFYLIPLFFLFTVIIVSTLLSRRFGKKFTRRYILVFLWGNFLLHFLKQLLPGYIDDQPYMLSKSSFENLCGGLVILSPFIFMWGNKYLKDYMFYIGIISGVGVYFYPSGIMNISLADPENLVEIIRFYACHLPLALCGFLMVDSGIHKLDYHRLWSIPFTFVCINFIVFLNSIFLWATGAWTRFYGDINKLENWKVFLSRRTMINNNASQIGPPMIQTKDARWGTADLIPWDKFMIPYLQTYHMDVKGVDTVCYVPSLWLFIPVALVTPPIGFVMSFRWEHRHMKMDLVTIKQRIKMRRSASSSSL